ncbi:MAG: hypothetical protein GW778_06600 [Alphaproteobacteria bacterium]|nr:hypothetical protein [Alphaproteobacteria bacterium]
MDQISSANSHTLLTCFFKECESQFRFLEETHGYLYLSGLAEYQRHFKVIKPYKDVKEPAKAPFYAVTRYERDNQAIEVFYGDRNYALEVYVYPDPARRLNLNDMISAARKTPSSARHLSYLTEDADISQSLKWFADTIRNNPKILSLDEKLIKRAEIMQQTLLEQSIRSHLDTQIAEASRRAAEAFADQDYTLVVALLDIYADYLGSADLKKLRIAHEKIS